jgi:folate-binding protein YgfZ
MFSLEKYEAARRSAVLFDRSARGKILFTGTDRLTFLNGLLTNDIARLTAGTGCYAAYLTPQGRMISDMRVLEFGTKTLLDVEAFVAASLRERFDTLVFSEDVQVRDATAELAELSILGPSAPALIGQLTGVPAARLQSMAEHDNLDGKWIQEPVDLVIVRDDAYRLPGFDVYVSEPKSAARIIASLVDQGTLEGDEELAETLRVEAGRPRFGVDMNVDTIPLEAGIEDRAISFTKGCYVGQEVIVRVLHRGHGRVAHRLVQLVLSDDVVPAAGDRIVADGSEIGRITSAVRSPMVGAVVALGYVNREFSAEGTEADVKNERRVLHARVQQIRD